MTQSANTFESLQMSLCICYLEEILSKNTRKLASMCTKQMLDYKMCVETVNKSQKALKGYIFPLV